MLLPRHRIASPLRENCVLLSLSLSRDDAPARTHARTHGMLRWSSPHHSPPTSACGRPIFTFTFHLILLLHFDAPTLSLSLTHSSALAFSSGSPAVKDVFSCDESDSSCRVQTHTHTPTLTFQRYSTVFSSSLFFLLFVFSRPLSCVRCLQRMTVIEFSKLSAGKRSSEVQKSTLLFRRARASSLLSSTFPVVRDDASSSAHLTACFALSLRRRKRRSSHTKFITPMLLHSNNNKTLFQLTRKKNHNLTDYSLSKPQTKVGKKINHQQKTKTKFKLRKNFAASRRSENRRRR